MSLRTLCGDEVNQVNHPTKGWQNHLKPLNVYLTIQFFLGKLLYKL